MTMAHMSIPHLLALHSITGIGSARLRLILEHYQGDSVCAWEDSASWCNIPQFHADASALFKAKADVNVDKVYENFLASGASIVTMYEDAYPAPLCDIYDPPVLLFFYGSLPKKEDICLALIGSRRASAYGRQVAEIVARDIAYQGIWVVSGMARGIDSICHKAAISANGKTLAVVGTGIDIVYPRENVSLYQEIIGHGAVISELPLGAPPLSSHFPQRNRIISGLSRGVVVIEAGEKSGTLLTVDYGLEQGKDIFAVPGPITSSLSKGTNRLLQQGAKMVTTAEDIWGEYLQEGKIPSLVQNNQEDAKTLEEKRIITLLLEPLHFDQLAQRSQIQPQKLAAILTLLEIRGIIKQLPGKYYQATIKNI